MKKILHLVLIFCLILSAASCGDAVKETQTAEKEVFDADRFTAQQLSRYAFEGKKKASSRALDGTFSSSEETVSYQARERYVKEGYEAYSYSYTLTREQVSTPAFGLYYENGTGAFFDGETLFQAKNLSGDAFSEQRAAFGAPYLPFFADWSEIEGLEKDGLKLSVSLDRDFPAFWQNAVSGTLVKAEGEQILDENGFFASEKVKLTLKTQEKETVLSYQVQMTALRDSGIRAEEVPGGMEENLVNDLRAPLVLKNARAALKEQKTLDFTLSEGVVAGENQHHSDRAVVLMGDGERFDFTVQEQESLRSQKDGEWVWTYFLNYDHFVGDTRTEAKFPMTFTETDEAHDEKQDPKKQEEEPADDEPKETKVTREEKEKAFETLLFTALGEPADLASMEMTDAADAYEIRFTAKPEWIAERSGEGLKASENAELDENEGLLRIEKATGLLKTVNFSAAWKENGADASYRFAFVLNATEGVQLGVIEAPQIADPGAHGED